MDKPKEYKIETIQDIANAINSENVDNFLQDFECSLKAYLLAKSIDKNVEYAKFTWIDDGKHEINIYIEEKLDANNSHVNVKENNVIDLYSRMILLIDKEYLKVLDFMKESSIEKIKESESPFKMNKQLKIINNVSSHPFKKGELVTIAGIRNSNSFLCRNSFYEYGYISQEDCNVL